MTSPPALSIAGLHQTFGTHQVLTDLHLDLTPGSILGLLGSNGAGKSTLISIAVGLLRPTSGEVRVFGIDVLRDRLNAARHIGYAPQSLGVYPTLTARQNLRIFAQLAGHRGAAAKRRVSNVLETLNLEDQADRLVAELSGKTGGGVARACSTDRAFDSPGR